MASIFWLDKELGSDVFLDGIVTVIDAKHGLQVCTNITLQTVICYELYFSNSF